MGGDVVETALDADPSWLALHAEREEVERALTLAQARQKFSSDPNTAAEARREEANKRVSNRRMKDELGVTLEYPDITSGVPAAVCADTAQP